MKRLFIVFLGCIVIISSASCRKRTIISPEGSGSPNLANWTVLVYLGGTNNLESLMEDDINLLEKIGSNPKFNMVVQFSKESTGGEAFRYFITKDEDTNVINSTPVSVGKVDSADYRVLKDFIIWGEQNYPANQMALIISSHGGGWTGIVEDTIQGSFMSGTDLQKAIREARFETNRKLDVLHIYSCLMGMWEVLYELKEEAYCIVASEISQYNYLNLDQPIKPLAEQSGVSRIEFSRALVKNFIEGYRNLPEDMGKIPQIYAAFDMLQADKLQTAIQNMTFALIRTFPWYGDVLREIARNCPSIEAEGIYSTYVDLRYFVQKIYSDNRIQEKTIKDTAAEVLKVLDLFILEKDFTEGNVDDNPFLLNLEEASGLSIWLPIDAFNLEVYSLYSKLDHSYDSPWISFLYSLNPANAYLLPQYQIGQWSLYDSKNYTVNLPRVNAFKPVPDGDNLIFFQGTYEAKENNLRFFGGYAEIGINVTQTITEADAMTWSKKVEATRVPLYTSYESVSNAPITIKNNTGHIMVGGGINKTGARLQEAHVFILRDGIGYDIYYIAEKPLFSEFLDVYLQICNSFTLK
ncbi:MAG: clostripain-related cysteine peptidase [Caldisericia bacterium]|nr:clostripain-related cysteine peptidase [Caldisericia bacterium]